MLRFKLETKYCTFLWQGWECNWFGVWDLGGLIGVRNEDEVNGVCVSRQQVHHIHLVVVSVEQLTEPWNLKQQQQQKVL